MTIDGALSILSTSRNFLSGLPPSHILDQDLVPLFKLKDEIREVKEAKKDDLLKYWFNPIFFRF